VAKLACVLFLVSSVSLARVVTATANIPFDFWAEGYKFAAGEYTFDTKTTIAVPVIIFGDPVRKEDAKIERRIENDARNRH
jgi:hypothetical protein